MGRIEAPVEGHYSAQSARIDKYNDARPGMRTWTRCSWKTIAFGIHIRIHIRIRIFIRIRFHLRFASFFLSPHVMFDFPCLCLVSSFPSTSLRFVFSSLPTATTMLHAASKCCTTWAVYWICQRTAGHPLSRVMHVCVHRLIQKLAATVYYMSEICRLKIIRNLDARSENGMRIWIMMFEFQITLLLTSNWKLTRGRQSTR